MSDYKEKYPIGSQWECPNGRRAVVVRHEKTKVEVYIEGVLGMPNPVILYEYSVLESFRPWKEQVKMEVRVYMVKSRDNRISVHVEPEYVFDDDIPSFPGEVIAKHYFTITEGDGINE